jgi:hypothetical protein
MKMEDEPTSSRSGFALIFSEQITEPTTAEPRAAVAPQAQWLGARQHDGAPLERAPRWRRETWIGGGRFEPTTSLVVAVSLA